MVSIHAPARGATSRAGAGGWDHSGFNPRSRAGSDLGEQTIDADRDVFQSTLPRGERRKEGVHRSWIRSFNPRSRAGSDRPGRSMEGKTKVFQSTLPRGERPSSTIRCCDAPMFQSTLPRGERRTVHILLPALAQGALRRVHPSWARARRARYHLHCCYLLAKERVLLPANLSAIGRALAVRDCQCIRQLVALAGPLPAWRHGVLRAGANLHQDNRIEDYLPLANTDPEGAV